jgi:hypothetical protein
MKLTVLILSLPLLPFICLLVAPYSDDAVQMPIYLLWVLLVAICLFRAYYISRRSRLAGWGCVGVVVVHFVALCWHIITYGVI